MSEWLNMTTLEELLRDMGQGLHFCGGDSAPRILGNFLSEGEVAFMVLREVWEDLGEELEKGKVGCFCFPALILPTR